MSQALGMVEVYGLVAAFAACDAGCKAAEVTVAPFDKNKPADPKGLPVPLQVLVKFRGSVEKRLLCRNEKGRLRTVFLYG